MVCNGCGGDMPEDEIVTTWFDTPLGYCAVHSHAGCKIRAALNISVQPVRERDEPRVKGIK